MNLQNKLIESIIKERNDDSPLVHEIAEILSISLDSAYRRLRGSTDLTANELEKLCKHYFISIDKLLEQKSDTINFSFNGTNSFQYSGYLEGLYHDLKKLDSRSNVRIIYDAKDIPVFYHFLFPEIAEFKGLFWEKTVYQNMECKRKKFNSEELIPKNVDLGKKIFNLYSKIPTIELWSDEILNSLLNQIKYYHESGFMVSEKDTMILFQKIEELIDHCELQAEEGCKKGIEENCEGKEDNLQLYYNEIVIGYNSVLLEYDNKREFHIGHNITNTLVCTDPDFCELTYQQKKKMLSSTTLISATSRKERTKFFNRLRNKLETLVGTLN